MRALRNHVRLSPLLISLIVSSLLFAITLSAPAQTRSVKVLVGGTLIDGFGSKPIRNSENIEKARIRVSPLFR
jgi:hypothetical protein